MRVWGLALLFAATFGSQADACMVNGFYFFFGTDTETTMNAESGKNCIVKLGTNNQASLKSARISAQAKNGFAGITGSNTPEYRSRPGFKGNDEFAATICGSSPARTGCTTLRVKVKVD